MTFLTFAHCDYSCVFVCIYSGTRTKAKAPKVSWEVHCVTGNLCTRLWEINLYSSWKRLWILSLVPPSLFVAYPYSPFFFPYKKVFHCSLLPLDSKDIVLHFHRFLKNEIWNLMITFLKWSQLEKQVKSLVKMLRNYQWMVSVTNSTHNCQDDQHL